MSDMNVVVLHGRLTRDPEMVQTPSSDNALCKFGLAVSRKWKDKEDTCFVDCEMWGKRAEVVGEHFHKGKAIIVHGHLRMDQWETKDGDKRSKLKVVVDDFNFVGKKGDDEGGTSGGYRADISSAKQGRRRQPPGPTNTKVGDEIDESSIPF